MTGPDVRAGHDFPGGLVAALSVAWVIGVSAAYYLGQHGLRGFLQAAGILPGERASEISSRRSDETPRA